MDAWARFIIGLKPLLLFGRDRAFPFDGKPTVFAGHPWRSPHYDYGLGHRDALLYGSALAFAVLGIGI